MVVRIRLARFGRKRAPFYNIVVAQARSAQRSRPMEVLGTYDPQPKTDLYDDTGNKHKDIKLDITRARYWVGVGAQPSDTVWRLFSMIGIMPPKHRPVGIVPPPFIPKEVPEAVDPATEGEAEMKPDAQA